MAAISKNRTPVDVRIGYAADSAGRGLAYARVGPAEGGHVLRVPFRIKRCTRLEGREIGYGALTAVAGMLRSRGIAQVRFGIDDEQLVGDVSERRELPGEMVMPYVRLRCALNQLERVTLERAECDDLVARARAEVAMHVAA